MMNYAPHIKDGLWVSAAVFSIAKKGAVKTAPLNVFILQTPLFL